MEAKPFSFKRSPHGKVRDSLLNSLQGCSDSRKSACNSNLARGLARNSMDSLIVPWGGANFADFGHNFRFSGFMSENSLLNSLHQGI